ncbi:Heme-binding protein 2 [Mactra antiquata]
MISTSLVLCACAAVAMTMSIQSVEEMQYTKDPPAFCHKLDCPRYEVVQTFKDYELRSYLSSMWVATNVTQMQFTEDDKKKQFNKLLDYISGQNDRSEKIAMTAPVLQTILHGQGPDCESTFTLHFMVPFNLQNSPPQPKASDVYITSLEPMDVYVRVFSGYANGTSTQTNLQTLADDINDSTKYIPNPYYDAVYDNPFQILDRHNEVWLQAKK